MRLFAILCLAVPLVVCAVVCDCVEWCIRREHRFESGWVYQVFYRRPVMDSDKSGKMKGV